MFKQNMSRKKLIISVIILAAAGLALVAFFKLKNKDKPLDKMTLEQAAKIGEAATYKLMIQIENPKGKAEDLAGRYERGDIILIKPAGHQFSLAEKEGTLIVKMDLTPAQTEVLIRAKEEEKTFWEEMKGRDEKEASKQLKRRKFAADLSKIGIAPEDEKGREIEDKVFKWDIVREK